MRKKYFHTGIVLVPLLFSACTVGPDYVRPKASTPGKFKEAPPGWKIANPQDDCDRGDWWKIFNDPDLDVLETKLNAANQSIKSAVALYLQARAIVDEARASFFPTVNVDASLTRQKIVSSGGLTSSGGNQFVQTGSTSTSTPSKTTHRYLTSHTLGFDATWEPDLWGSVRRTVESKEETAQATEAQLALTRLSSQASLAQYYFELRGLDRDQELLDATVNDNRRILQITKNLYAQGVDAQADVLLAQSQFESSQAAAINNGILRGQYEHAIAVLIGEPPANFSLQPVNKTVTIPEIPLELPCALLERRPDIAQAERMMAAANAEIGVAKAAYFPALTLTASGIVQHRGYNHWFSLPDLAWTLTSQLAETVYDGGLRAATVRAARANYDSTVAVYRQTVLTAFQDVEDNLVSLRLLSAQAAALNKAAADARLSLQLITNQYKAGTVAYTSVLTAANTAYAAEKSAADVVYLQMTSAVLLVKALGGGWNPQEMFKDNH